MILDTCIPDSKRMPDVYAIHNFCKTSSSHHHSNQLQTIHCAENLLAGFGAGNACCKSGLCDKYKQNTYFNLSSSQYTYPLEKNVSLFDVNGGAKSTFGPESRSTSLQAVPIYILTQSIIC